MSHCAHGRDRQLLLRTSAGEVEGEICSDLTIALGVDDPASGVVADADGTVATRRDVARHVVSVGGPSEEAEQLVEAWWESAVAPVWDEWVRRDDEFRSRRGRPRVLGRLRRRN